MVVAVAVVVVVVAITVVVVDAVMGCVVVMGYGLWVVFKKGTKTQIMEKCL